MVYRTPDRERINADYMTELQRSGMSDADFAKTPGYAQFASKLTGNYSSLTDAGEIDNELAYQQGRINDPVHGASAAEFVRTLQGRKAAVNQTSNPQSNGGGAGGGAGATTLKPLPRIWTDQDASVSGRLPGLLSQSNPLMKLAAATGERTAARRGLQNSSIAVGSAQKEIINVALPIASQEAGQVHQRNHAGQGYEQEANLQGQRLESGERVAGMQIASAEKISLQEQNAAMQRLMQQGVDARAIQAMGDAAAKARLGEQLTSQEKIALEQLTAENTRFNKSELGLNTRFTAQLNETRDQGKLNRDVDTRNIINTAVTNANNTYTNAVNAINSNPELPIESRNILIANAAAVRDAQINLIEDLWDVDLDWPGATA